MFFVQEGSDRVAPLKNYRRRRKDGARWRALFPHSFFLQSRVSASCRGGWLHSYLELTIVIYTYTGPTAERRCERKGGVCIVHVAVAKEVSQERVARSSLFSPTSIALYPAADQVIKIHKIHQYPSISIKSPTGKNKGDMYICMCIKLIKTPGSRCKAGLLVLSKML